jgi:hypothetical protein
MVKEHCEEVAAMKKMWDEGRMPRTTPRKLQATSVPRSLNPTIWAKQKQNRTWASEIIDWAIRTSVTSVSG